MNEPMDHAEISEQLRAFALGELSHDQALRVRTHLAGCGACTNEYRALESLLQLPAEEPTELESRRLRAQVLAALEPSEQAVVGLGKPSPFRARIAQALGAAALLALVAGIGYVATNLSGGSDGGGVAEGGAADTAGGGGVADIGFELHFRRPQSDPFGTTLDQSVEEPPAPEGAEDLTVEQQPKEGADNDQGSVSGGGAGGARTLDEPVGDGQVRPLYVRGAGILSDRKLALVGRYGLPLVLFPQTYTPADATDLQTDFLARLANAAETPERSDRILECGSAVLARPHPVLPALATYGRLDNEPTLVMAFAWTDAPDGPLDQFMVWSWPRGDCAAAPGYRAGFINR
ncbi:MAG TPA: zf-HC2 domain-containing protein [Actinomycetota bacterium]|nr:zf-HC2 domain-containing protein [Actinomycetota bacterium]